MSKDAYNGGLVQIASGLRWGGTCNLVDYAVTFCGYAFQVVDQNGEPIRMRQRVSVGCCACASAIATTDAGLGPKVPTAAEIANSALLETVAPAVILANAEAVIPVRVGSSSPALSSNPAAPLDLAGPIGIHGQIQSYVYEGAAGTDTCQWLFETDADGRFSLMTTAFPATTALVICLSSGKVLYFNGGAA